MKKIDAIQQMKNNKLDKYIERRIRKLEKQNKNEEQVVLGFDIDYNYRPVTYHELDNSIEYEVGATTCYPKYIPKNSKVVYAMYFNPKAGTVANNGQYYYVDDDSYIKDFCKYIKDCEIENVRILLDYIFDFIDLYFGVVKLDDRKREDFNRLIYKNSNSYYPLTEEHKLSKFKKESKAECTEVAILAQNILKFLGFESYIIIGDIQYSCENETTSHAFNLISYKNKKKNKQVNLLVDFSSSVIVYDMNFNKIGLSPFIGELDKEPKDAIGDLVNPDKGLTFENYSYIAFGDKVLSWIQDVERKYSVSFSMKPVNDEIKENVIKEKNNEKVYFNNYHIR